MLKMINGYKKKGLIQLTRLDKIFILFTVMDLVIIFFPWQFVPYNNSEKSIYRIMLHSIWSFGFLYFFSRSNTITAYKKTARVITCILFISGFLIVAVSVFFFGLPAEFDYEICYEKETNINEKVLHIYYRGFLPTQGKWDLKRIIDIPDWHFRFEKPFDKNDLNGLWKAYNWKNNSKDYQTVYFVKGEITKK